MATWNKRKLAVWNKENCEEHPRSNLAQNSNVLRSQEDYITQVSEEIEGRVTKKLSKEFSRTENRILSALARLDDFLMNPLIQGHSGTTPDTSRNVFSINQGTNEDDSQSDPHPEAGLFNNQMTQNSGPEDGHYMVAEVQKESLREQYVVTGVTENLRDRHHMVTGATERHYMATGVQRERVFAATTWWQGLQNATTWWQEFKERVFATVTWWEELQNRFGIATTWQEFTKKSLTAPLAHLQVSRKRTALQVNHNSAVKTSLRRLRQTKFCWPFNSWQTTTILQISVTISTEFPYCQSHLRQRCLLSTGNLKSSSCLKIFSKPVSKFIISWLKMTESTTSILSWGEIRYKHLKILMAQPGRIWEKFWQFSEGNIQNPNPWRQQNANSRNLSSTQQIKS